MTIAEKAKMLRTLLSDKEVEPPSEDVLETLLRLSAKEIIDWRYSHSRHYDDITDVPREYETTQIYAIIAGYSLIGAENQTSHNENGISRVFKHSDMVHYIRANVPHIVGIGGVRNADA